MKRVFDIFIMIVLVTLLVLVSVFLWNVEVEAVTVSVEVRGPQNVYPYIVQTRIIPQRTRMLAEVSAYSSTPDQTSGNPFITASGQRVHHGVVANNCLEFGTEVEIQGIVYAVWDRLNSRYGCEVFDIWMETREEANDWGRKSIYVEV